jgi:hypothetical protein
MYTNLMGTIIQLSNLKHCEYAIVSLVARCCTHWLAIFPF